VAKQRELQFLLDRSEKFCQTAEMQIQRGYYDLAAFSLEQCLQLYLKAALLQLGVDYPKIHGVRELLSIIYELTGGEEIDEAAKRYSVELGALEDAYISSRYIPRAYTREEAERLKNVVGEIKRVVERALAKAGQKESGGP
jgi:HEPN domain-containing protein